MVMFKESDKGADPAKTFTVKDPALIVAGKPTCYIHTEKGYSNYVPAAAPRRSGCPASGGSYVERAAPEGNSGRAAGYDGTALIGRGRGPGPLVRGCQVVDLIPGPG